MVYNFLRSAFSVKNSDLCMYDTNIGFSTNFSRNGDVDNWEEYYNVYMYGAWSGILFGSSYEDFCYIGRNELFISVNAEKFYIIEIMMQIIDNNPNAATDTLTKGKIQWQRINDNYWSDDRSLEFDLESVGSWHLYKLNMAPLKDWQGEVANLRLYPFLDGRSKDQFFIKFIRIVSTTYWSCSNHACDFYVNYTHPCPAVGRSFSLEAAEHKDTYTTISGVNSTLLLNIDDYGYEYIELGTNLNYRINEMARVLSNAISTINIGGYAYSNVAVSEAKAIKIASGTKGVHSSVKLKYTPAAEELGFFNSLHEPTYIEVLGENPASGYDYSATRLLPAYELNAIIDNKFGKAYTHNTKSYTVEAGRRDYSEVGLTKAISQLELFDGEISFDNLGKTIIDLTHPVDNNGRLTNFWAYGVAYNNAQVVILTPHNDGTYTLKYALPFEFKNTDYLYTVKPVVSYIQDSILVSKGDIMGVYNFDLYVGHTQTGKPNATFALFDGVVTNRCKPSKVYSYGVGGFSIYARGDLKQTNSIIDIDLGDRLNVSELLLYGYETQSTFEFNLAACLDLTWDVNLFNESHDHKGMYTFNETGWHDVHLNKYYGKSCLDDLVRTADNGQVGTSYSLDGDGLNTFGPHSYFYVNGDAEWLYSKACTGKTEYCGHKVPQTTYNYKHDPIAFTMYFPNEVPYVIHKSIIYFKEEKNFRNIALSCFMGNYYRKGDADDKRFKLIPEYLKICNDGAWYKPGENRDITAYLFNNPTISEITDYNDKEQEKQFLASKFVDWTILGHEFKPFTCYGFRLFTDYHESTKLTEIELYSFINNDTTLTDNAYIQYSEYGDFWVTEGFKEVEEKVVSAYIGATPRYLRLVLESHLNFDIHEVFLSVTPQKGQESTALVLLQDAKRNVISDSVPYAIQNVFDKPFDLTIDLPKDLNLYTNIIYWNKLVNMEQITKAALGPKALLYKQAPFRITAYRGQCATRAHTYGLKNLVLSKDIYYVANGYDITFLKTMNDIDPLVDVYNTHYLNTYRHTLSFSPVSSKFWRVNCLTADRILKIRDVLCFYNSNRVVINNLLVDYVDTLGSSKYDTNGVTIQRNDLFISGFSTGSLTKWIITGEESSESYEDHVTIRRTTQDLFMTSESFYTTRDFEFECTYSIDIDNVPSYDLYSDIKFIFYKAYTILFYIRIYQTKVANCNDGQFKHRIYIVDGNDTTLFYDTYKGSFLCANKLHTLKVYKVLNTITLYIDNNHITTLDIVTLDIVDTVVFYSKNQNYYNVDSYTFYSFDFYQSLLLYKDTFFGIELLENVPVDTIYIIASDDYFQHEILTSYNNIDYFLLSGSVDTHVEDNKIAIIVDLQKRHSLYIIRNYGNNSNLYDISTNLNAYYSNSDILDLNSFTSTKEDCRYLLLYIPSSDLTIRCIYKLGIYSDITTYLCKNGGYNNEWVSLGNALTLRPTIFNVAYNKKVVVNTESDLGGMEYITDGDVSPNSGDKVWKYLKGTTPELIIDLEATYTLVGFRLYSGYNPEAPSPLNTDFTFYVSPTVSGTDFIDVYTATGITTNEPELFKIDAINARRVKLVINSFTTIRQHILIDNNARYVDVGMLRELEVLSRDPLVEISSEDYPILCCDLIDSFNVVGHSVYNSRFQPKDTTANSLKNTLWDNNDKYFYYSDTTIVEPSKVAFQKNRSYVPILTYPAKETLVGLWEFIIEDSLYLSIGVHYLTWEAYNPEAVGEISLTFKGEETIHIYATTYGVGWLAQNKEFFINQEGYYKVSLKQHINNLNSWGGGNIILKRAYGLTRWVAFERDTATNYSYDFDENKYGPDYIDLLDLYGDSRYDVVAYHWWWETDLSTLSNDSHYVKESKRSLRVDYPTSSGIEYLRFAQGDVFGNDKHWSIYDVFSVNLYIDNISSFDIAYGSILLGSVHLLPGDFYYEWYFSDMSLHTGWNNLRLCFNDASKYYPEKSKRGFQYRHPNLNMKSSEVFINTLNVTFRGVGNAMTLYFDNFSIKRNYFDTQVRFGKGLCLTSQDHLAIPLSNVSLEQGTIEFWTRFGVSSLGLDAFGDLYSATLFTLTNNNNDIVSLRIRPANWLEILVGSIRQQILYNIGSASIPNIFINKDEITHIALVWSSNGLGMDNKDTVRLYVNGMSTLTGQDTWEVNDTKIVYLKLGGGISQSSEVFGSFGNFMYNNLKVYNYCKTTFNINQENIAGEITYQPEEFIEISKDNQTFYGVGAKELPLFFEKVPAGESRTIFIRSNKTNNFQVDESTAQILLNWLTTV